MITIKQLDSAFGQILIRRSRATGALIYWQGDCYQSEASPDGVSLTRYVHALFGLLRQTDAREILLIGCGGGTLATMLYRAGASVTVVDVNPNAFEVARAYFAMPADVSCVVDDGYNFLLRTDATFDAIVLDAYDGGEIPPQFLRTFFARLARARLRAPQGIFLANVYVNDDLDTKADFLAVRLSRFFPTVRLLDERGSLNRNTIVMAGPVKDLLCPRLEMRPRLGGGLIEDELARLSFRPILPLDRIRFRPRGRRNTGESND